MTTTGKTHNKKALHVLRAGKASPLSFNGVLIYSFLVYRRKMAKDNVHKAMVTQSAIHAGTGLDPNRAIPRARDELLRYGLISKHDGKLYAKQPPDWSWFVTMSNKEKRPWHSRFAYLRILLPSNGLDTKLTPRQNMLYWLIDCKPEQAQKYYALRLGVTTKTVRSAVTKLCQMELISCELHKRGWPILETLPLADGHGSLWQDKTRRTKPSPEKAARKICLSQCFIFPEEYVYVFFVSRRCEDGCQRDASWWMRKKIDQSGIAMLEAGYTDKDILHFKDEVLAIFGKAYKPMLFFEWFMRSHWDSVFEAAEKKTMENRHRSKFAGPNSRGLLLKYTNDASIQMQDVYRRLARRGDIGTCPWRWEPPT